MEIVVQNADTFKTLQTYPRMTANDILLMLGLDTRLYKVISRQGLFSTKGKKILSAELKKSSLVEKNGDYFEIEFDTFVELVFEDSVTKFFVGHGSTVGNILQMLARFEVDLFPYFEERKLRKSEDLMLFVGQKIMLKEKSIKSLFRQIGDKFKRKKPAKLNMTKEEKSCLDFFVPVSASKSNSTKVVATPISEDLSILMFSSMYKVLKQNLTDNGLKSSSLLIQKFGRLLERFFVHTKEFDSKQKLLLEFDEFFRVQRKKPEYEKKDCGVQTFEQEIKVEIQDLGTQTEFECSAVSCQTVGEFVDSTIQTNHTVVSSGVQSGSDYVDRKSDPGFIYCESSMQSIEVLNIDVHPSEIPNGKHSLRESAERQEKTTQTEHIDAFAIPSLSPPSQIAVDLETTEVKIVAPLPLPPVFKSSIPSPPPPPPVLGSSIPPPPPPPPMLGSSIPPPPPPPPMLGSSIPPPPPPPPVLGSSIPPPPPPPMTGFRIPTPPPPPAPSMPSTPRKNSFSSPITPPRSNAPSVFIPTPKKQMKPLFWNKIPTYKLDGTVWTEIDDEDIDFDFQELESLFNAEKVDVKQKMTKKESIATLLSLPRANNVCIMLARLKKDEQVILNAILELDDCLTLANLQALASSLPEEDEITTIKEYDGDLPLGKAEKYFLAVSDIPQYKLRLQMMILRKTFVVEYSEIFPEVDLVIKCFEEILSSNNLKMALKTVLKCGNYLNSGSFRGNAAGFQLEALTKLQDIRAQGQTLLQYLSRLEYFNIQQDLTLLQKVSKISISTLKSNAATLLKQFSAAEKLEYKQTDENDRFKQKMSLFIQKQSSKKLKLEDKTEQLCLLESQVLKYFGEEKDTEKVLSILNSFAENIEKGRGTVKVTKRRRMDSVLDELTSKCTLIK